MGFFRQIKETLHLLLLKSTGRVSRSIASIRAPYSIKGVTLDDYYECLKLVKPGYIFLSATHGEAAALFIPGYYKHAGIVTRTPASLPGASDGRTMITEAIGKGVSPTDMIQFFMTKDRIALLRPMFCDATEALMASVKAASLEGKSYDWEFASGNDAYYCSEVIWYSYNAILGERFPFEMRKRFGQDSVSPQDFSNAADKWEVVWESKAGRGEKKQ